MAANYLLFGSMGEFRLFNAKMNTHFGYPKPGVNAATGLPVNVDGATKNSRGDRKGWTERYTDAVEHPSDGRFVAYIDQVGLDAVDGQGQPVVSASERGLLKSREQVIADGFTRDRPNHSELAMADGRA